MAATLLLVQPGTRLLAWSLVFFIDVRASDILNGADLLPDFVGYGLMLLGLRRLRQFHRRFVLAHHMAVVAFVVSIAELLASVSTNAPLYVSTALEAIAILFEMLVLWQITTGIAEVADQAQRMLLAKRARSRRNMFVAVPLIAGLVLFASFINLSFGFVLFLPSFVFVIVVYFLMFGLMRRAGSELNDRPSS